MPLKGYTAIFGGSFNPPHMGHQLICMWLVQALRAEVLVVPTFEHNFGKKLEPFDHRLAMCELMVRPIKGVSSTGIESFLPKPNTTYGLLKHFSVCEDKLAVVIGSELLEDLTKWHKWEELPSLAKFVVVERTGFSKGQAPFEVTEFPMKLPATSSSEVRHRLADGNTIDGLVPYSVKEYIYKHGLYQANK